MSLELRAAGRSDVGMVRERNEDSSFFGRHVFAVADGLGGHRAGEVASNVALGSISSLDQLDAQTAASKVAEAVRKGNRAVYDRARADVSLKGMATTLTAVAVSDGRAHLAHVGDSRCYLLRAGSIMQLSRDHTLVARMVDEGRLTPEQAEAHPQRSIVTRALGHEVDVDVDESRIDLVPGDRLLLCSDGLSGVLSDEEIRTLATDGDDLDAICNTLIDEANARGGPDNITAIVVDVSGTAPARATPRGRRLRRLPRRPLAWAAILSVLIAGGTLGMRAWIDRSFFLGASTGNVVIERGLPVEFLGIELHSIEQHTDIPVVRLPQYLRRELDAGIRVSSLDEARKRLESIRTHVPGEGRSTPSPSPSPTSKGSP